MGFTLPPHPFIWGVRSKEGVALSWGLFGRSRNWYPAQYVSAKSLPDLTLDQRKVALPGPVWLAGGGEPDALSRTPAPAHHGDGESPSSFADRLLGGINPH